MVNMREGRFEDVFGGDAESLTAVAHCGHCTLEGPCPPRCVLCASDRLFGNTPLEQAIDILELYPVELRAKVERVKKNLGVALEVAQRVYGYEAELAYISGLKAARDILEEEFPDATD